MNDFYIIQKETLLHLSKNHNIEGKVTNIATSITTSTTDQYLNSTNAMGRFAVFLEND